jgi:spore coat protein U-like protein
MNKKVAYLAVAGALLVSSDALAATVTADLNVTATVVADCSVAVGGDLAFGNITTTTSTTYDAATTATVTCSAVIPYVVGIDYGQDGSQRTMWDSVGNTSGNTLTYNVYTDSARTVPFGPPIGGDPGSITSAGALSNTIDIYGRTDTQSTPPTGTYTDTLQVLVEY